MPVKIKLCSADLCTGCTCCQAICSQDAISMKPDDNGFLFPEIDYLRCINCGQCVSHCPQLNPPPDCSDKLENETCFSIAHPNPEIRAGSTSGGGFTILAEIILAQGGTVWGAAYDENLQVRHICVKSASELPQLRFSKYVQSDLQNSFRQIRTELRRTSSAPVLFSGTPCQIMGLSAYLHGTDQTKLFTCEVICHGTPSAGLFRSYLDFLEKRRRATVTEFCFRDKSKGWHDARRSGTVNGKKCFFSGDEDAFCSFFYQNLSLRESCFECPRHTRSGGIADYTIGDFWSYPKENIEILSLGLSFLLCHTIHGELLLQKIRPGILQPGDRAAAYAGNPHLTHSARRPVAYRNFMESAATDDFAGLVEKFHNRGLRFRLSEKLRHYMPKYFFLIIRYLWGRVR